jgi:cysteine desulfurase
MSIYLDHNAGSPLRPEARDAIERYLSAPGGNPSSIHRSGQRARQALERAREQVAGLIGAPARAIVFTSGGTEANNLAIRGTCPHGARRMQIVTTAIEHSSVLAPLQDLEAAGFDVVLIAPDTLGRVATDRIVESIGSSTALVTVGLANGEVGTILEHPALVAQACADNRAIFHLDGAQAAGRMRIDVNELACDLMTLSAHKIGGPAGIGALYVRDASRITPQISGGPHELGLRAGTQNLLGAIGFGAAAQACAAALESQRARMRAMTADLLARLRAAIPGIRLNGPEDGRLPNTLNIRIPGVIGETMLIALDLAGVEVSMGSACAAGSVDPSHVLMAMGLGREAARSSLRISIGWSTTPAEIETAAGIIAATWMRIAGTDAPAAEAHT